MRRAFWGLALLPLLLSGCITRSLWRKEHRDRCCWTAYAELALARSDHGVGPPVVVMGWPGAEQWERLDGRRTLPTPAVIGLSEDTTRVQLLPKQWPASMLTLLSPTTTAVEGVGPFVTMTIALGVAEGELTLELFGDDVATESALPHLPGLVAERFCFTCGASRLTLRDRAALAAIAPELGLLTAPTQGAPAQLYLVERTPVGVGEKIALTPFAAAADLVLLPFELLTIRVWWGE